MVAISHWQISGQVDKILIGEVDVYGTCDYYVGPISVGMHGQVTFVDIMEKPYADAIGSTIGRISRNNNM